MDRRRMSSVGYGGDPGERASGGVRTTWLLLGVTTYKEFKKRPGEAA